MHAISLSLSLSLSLYLSISLSLYLSISLSLFLLLPQGMRGLSNPPASWPPNMLLGLLEGGKRLCYSTAAQAGLTETKQRQ